MPELAKKGASPKGPDDFWLRRRRSIVGIVKTMPPPRFLSRSKIVSAKCLIDYVTEPKLQAAFHLPLFLILLSHAALAAENQTVVEALTGDSVKLKGGKILRYIGLQSPPLQSLILLERQYGATALEFNRRLVEGKGVRIVWDSQIRDNHNCLLGYVYLEDGTFVNQAILEAGHAKARLVAPNLKYAVLFRRVELGARRHRKGLWQKEPENPYIRSEYIGEKNTKLYYLPASPELERIPQANLVTFQSRVDAKAAGYQPCPTCKGGAVVDDFDSY